MRPFRFAVQAVDATSAKEWREVARRAQDLGYSTLFVADHYLGPGPAGSGSLMAPQQLAPIAAMATAAAVTETLRVGCRVFCMDYHVPAVLAKEAATIDVLSEGRLEFGIGAGWQAAEYEAMGLTFGDPGRRVAKLEETVALVKAHWAGEEMDIDGEYVRASGYAGLPAPVQLPHPPIMIGGSRKRVLALAGREADIVSLANVPWVAVNEAGLTPVEEAVRRVGYARGAAGSRFEQLDVETSPYFSEITDRIDEALARLSASMRGADPAVLRDHPNVLVGPVARIVDQLEQRRSVIGANYITVPQHLMDDFAPVCSALSGR